MRRRIHLYSLTLNIFLEAYQYLELNLFETDHQRKKPYLVEKVGTSCTHTNDGGNGTALE